MVPLQLKDSLELFLCLCTTPLESAPSDNIKAADSVQNFKKQLKTLLFQKEFN